MAAQQPDRVPLPSKLPYNFPVVLRRRLESALVNSPRKPINRLQVGLDRAVDQSGWTQRLAEQSQRRATETDRFLQQQKHLSRRNIAEAQGAANRELLEDFIEASQLTRESQSTDEEVDRLRQEGMMIPEELIEQAVKMLKEELEQLCEIDDDKYVDWRTNV